MTKAAAKAPTPALPAFEFPKMDMAGMDMPAAFREVTEKAVGSMKDAYTKYKTFAEEATESMEKTYATSSKHATELNATLLANAKTNLNASFDHAEKLIGVKTFAEALELQSEFARAQFETFSAQAKELQEKATKVAEESAKPVQENVAKMMDSMKAA